MRKKLAQKNSLKMMKTTASSDKVSNITIINYDSQKFERIETIDPKICSKQKFSSGITWISVEGVFNIETIENLCLPFNIHHLTIEDIFNPNHRPKFEIYDDYVFILLKRITYNKDNLEFQSDQASIILFKNMVISFIENDDNVFDSIKEAIEKQKGKIRKMGADYLAYVLIDTIIDIDYQFLEGLSDKIENYENEIILEPTPKLLNEIHKLKRDLVLIRKSVTPLREVIGAILRDDNDYINENIRIYFRDIYDHVIQISDTIETYRDIISGLIDIYLTNMNNVMNNVMKMLTLIATIFIPLTFIAGVYGMNFENMPELKWAYGYPFALCFMFIIGFGMYIYFKKKNWF